MNSYKGIFQHALAVIKTKKVHFDVRLIEALRANWQKCT